jgi:hypothetical protein
MQNMTDERQADDLAHDHIFDQGNHAAERGTRLVMWITRR